MNYMPKYVPLTNKQSLSNIERYMHQKEVLIEETRNAMSGLYEPIIVDGVVTNYGVNTKGEVFSYINARILDGAINIDGKKHVTLCYQKNGMRVYRRRAIDHIVATAFIPNPDCCKYVCHYDNDPLNNDVTNLFWTNRKEVSTNGLSGDDIIEIFNAVLYDAKSNLLNNMSDWVREKFRYIIRHIKEQNIPLDGKILLKGYRKIINNGIISDRYEISPFGIIRNANTNRYLVGSLSYYGYPIFKIDLEKKQNIAIHRLVANTFIPNPDNLSDVHHINSEKIDSCVWNLAWESHQQNMERAISLGEMTYGEDCHLSKHSNNQIENVCKLLVERQYSPTKISEMTGVSITTISDIRSGSRWKRISSKYDIPYCIYDQNDKYVGIDNAMTAKTAIKLAEYRRKLSMDNTPNNIIIPELYDNDPLS